MYYALWNKDMYVSTYCQSNLTIINSILTFLHVEGKQLELLKEKNWEFK